MPAIPFCFYWVFKISLNLALCSFFISCSWNVFFFSPPRNSSVIFFSFSFSVLCLTVWADADTWFERQQQEEEMQRLQAENRAAMQEAEDLHRKKMAQEREGEKEDEAEINDDPMARAEAEALKQQS